MSKNDLHTYRKWFPLNRDFQTNLHRNFFLPLSTAKRLQKRHALCLWRWLCVNTVLYIWTGLWVFFLPSQYLQMNMPVFQWQKEKWQGRVSLGESSSISLLSAAFIGGKLFQNSPHSFPYKEYLPWIYMRFLWTKLNKRLVGMLTPSYRKPHAEQTHLNHIMHSLSVRQRVILWFSGWNEVQQIPF